MSDPRLFDQMHGAFTDQKVLKVQTDTDEKDRFLEALKDSIKEYVETVIQNEDHTNKLLNPVELRAKLEQETLKAVELSDLGQLLSSAIYILETEGNRYLEEEAYQTLLQDFNLIRERMNALDEKHLTDESLKETLSISTKGRESILKIGMAKFSEELFQDSLVIFILLSNLHSEEPIYWYKLGLVAQRTEQYDLAVKAYGVAASLAPELVGAHIFKAQCFLKMDQFESASIELEEAQNILKKTAGEEEWGKHIIDIKNLLDYAGSINKGEQNG